MLTPLEEKNFYEKGYIKLTSFIPSSLLIKLHALFHELMNDADSDGKVIYENKGKKYVTNIDEICKKGNLAALELLGYPPLLEIAQQLCGDDFFMIQEFAVIKNLGDELPVLWHLDMLHERKGNCFTIGFYLDDVEEGDGALKIVPGSHLSTKTICELSKEPFIEMPAKAGDILIHDMMLAHSSEPLWKNKIRRVVYFEFLSEAHVRTENIYSEELIERRKKLMPASVNYYEALHPHKTPFAIAGNIGGSNEILHELLAEIYSEQIKARPSSYCFEFKMQQQELIS